MSTHRPGRDSLEQPRFTVLKPPVSIRGKEVPAPWELVRGSYDAQHLLIGGFEAMTQLQKCAEKTRNMYASQLYKVRISSFKCERTAQRKSQQFNQQLRVWGQACAATAHFTMHEPQANPNTTTTMRVLLHIGRHRNQMIHPFSSKTKKKSLGCFQRDLRHQH